MELQEIAEDWLVNYVSEDGLASITRDDFRHPFEGFQLKTVRNDNGALFLCYGIILLCKAGYDISSLNPRVYEAIKRLEVEPGLYSRRQGDPRLEAHDNPAAIVCLSSIFDFSFAEERCIYGARNGYSYDNTKSEKFSGNMLVQGGEVCLYKICAGWIPAVWELLWLCGGMLTNAFQSKKAEPAISNTLLNWMRIECLSQLKTGHGWMDRVLDWVFMFWRFMMRRKFGSMYYVFGRYFQEINNPYVRLAKIVYGS